MYPKLNTIKWPIKNYLKSNLPCEHDQPAVLYWLVDGGTN